MWFPLPLSQCWPIFMNRLTKTEENYGFQTHSFVLMGNHYHWFVSTPQSNLGEGMCYFNTQVSKDISLRADFKNHIFGSRYKPTQINDPIQYALVYRYIYQNPVRAGICESVFDYEWSTLNKGDILLHPKPAFDSLLPPTRDISTWLNKVPAQFVNERIQSALQKRNFKLPRDKNKKRNHGNGYL